MSTFKRLSPHELPQAKVAPTDTAGPLSEANPNPLPDMREEAPANIAPYQPHAEEQQQDKAEDKAASNNQVAPEHPIKAIQRFFSDQKVIDRIASHCGTDQVGVERIVRGLISAIRTSQDDELVYCIPASFLDCIYDAHAMGLAIDGRQHCYLVRYKKEAKVQPGYKGYVNRLYEGLVDVDIQTFLVWQEDRFIESSIDGVATYDFAPAKSFRQDYGTIVGAFCYISYWVAGEKKAVIGKLGVTDIANIRNAAKTQKAWNAWFDQQVLKSVIRRTCKLRFASLTDKLDAADNEHFELEGPAAGKGAAKESQAERFRKKMSEDKYQGAAGAGGIAGGGGGGPVVEGTAVTVPDARPVDPVGVPPSDPEPERYEGSNPLPENLVGVDPWDGEIYINKKPVEQAWPDIKNAYNYLVGAMVKRSTAGARWDMIDENLTLMVSLWNEHRELYTSLLDLAEKGSKKTKGKS